MTKDQTEKLLELLERLIETGAAGTIVRDSTITGPVIPPVNAHTRAAIIALAAAATENAKTIAKIADCLQLGEVKSVGIAINSDGRF